jgi:hypothetical protein
VEGVRGEEGQGSDLLVLTFRLAEIVIRTIKQTHGIT